VAAEVAIRSIALLCLVACTPSTAVDPDDAWEPISLNACIDEGSGRLSMATSVVPCERPANASCDASGSDPIELTGSAEVGACTVDAFPGCDMIVADCGVDTQPTDTVDVDGEVVSIADLPDCLAYCGE
jgi:hypothetical protein